MKIGGLQKITLVDFPDKIAATVFLTGCNFKCGFCHNPDLVRPELASELSPISESDFFAFLDENKGLVDGVCITGGEPTINTDLIDFVQKIKAKGFAVKLDTNGSNSEILEKIIQKKLADFIAMDIKTSIKNYDRATGVEANIKNIKRSVKIIKNSGIDYEFRTTVVPGIVEKEDIEKIGQWLQGAKKIALQQFRNQKVLDSSYVSLRSYSQKTLEEFKKILEKYVDKVELRL